MKKITAFAIIFLFYASVIYAQSFHVGLKAGSNLQKIHGAPFKDKFTFGYHGGGYARIGLSKKIGIQPEVLFSGENADTATQFSTVYGFKQINKVKLNYLNIPVLLNIKVVKFVSLQAGPQFSILLNKNKSLLKNGESAFKDGNIAAAVGLQLKFSKIIVNGRYVAGFYNINEVSNGDSWRNRNIQVGVGYNIY